MTLTAPPGFRVVRWKDLDHLVREGTVGPVWLLLCGKETHPTRPPAQLLDADAEILVFCKGCMRDFALWTRPLKRLRFAPP